MSKMIQTFTWGDTKIILSYTERFWRIVKNIIDTPDEILVSKDLPNILEILL